LSKKKPKLSAREATRVDRRRRPTGLLIRKKMEEL
jgi:hypothetical protein